MKASRWSRNPLATKLAPIKQIEVVEIGKGRAKKTYLLFTMPTPCGLSERMRVELSRAQAMELAGRLAVPAVNILFQRKK